MEYGDSLKPALLLTAFLLTTLAAAAGGQTPQGGYRMPPVEIADLVDAPGTPLIRLNPSREWMLVIERPGLPDLEEMAEPELRLAGVRLNPANFGPSRSWTYREMWFRRLEDGLERPVTGLPGDARISHAGWSPDGGRIAFMVTRPERLELWVASLSDGRAKRLTDRPLNAVLADPFTWAPDGMSILAFTVPDGYGPEPEAPRLPDGPVIQENLGRRAPARTYQDLLTNAHDADLFEYYTTSRLLRIGLDGRTSALGVPAMYSSADPSPDGRFVMVEMIRRPFSYALPVSRFPLRTEVLDAKGEAVHLVADLPLADEIPVAFGSVRTGPRSVGWRADADAQLCWAEALDGGDAGFETGERDRVFLLSAPFRGEPRELMTLAVRYSGIMWGRGDLALLSEFWWRTRETRTWRVRPDEPGSDPELLVERSFEDRYSDPGSPMTRNTNRGTSVILTSADGGAIFLSGDGASPEGDRPFLDRYDISTRESERLFQSESPCYEQPIVLLDPEEGLLLTRREAVEEPPNFHLRNMKTGETRAKTEFPHPTPALIGVQKEQIRYAREDGVQLTATLYLPSGYSPEKDGPLPAILWAYPRDYRSADAAGQVRDSPYRFVRVGWSSPVIWVVRGYAVLDNPAMPVIGEGDEEPNDSFVKQLVGSAGAAIDEIVRRGVADRDRMAVGGHSYGAFMAANLLAHSDLFRLGLARSGAYNRTLTPFGFQSEERTIWQAPEVYATMSPFMHADRITAPILMTHGMDDNNPGTYPMQSERFYEALKGMGATVRLVMLPFESHNYRARQSVMHVLWETSDWLDRYVKDAGPRASADPGSGDSGS